MVFLTFLYNTVLIITVESGHLYVFAIPTGDSPAWIQVFNRSSSALHIPALRSLDPGEYHSLQYIFVYFLADIMTVHDVRCLVL
jgi:hypothetical protein